MTRAFLHVITQIKARFEAHVVFVEIALVTPRIISLPLPAPQSLWSPQLVDASDVGAQPATPQSSSPDKCAFCNAVVPQECMNSHLYSHFSPRSEADQ